MLAYVVAVLATAACNGEDAPPSHLLDGSDSRPPSVTLQGVAGPAIVASTAVTPAAAVASARESCAGFAGPAPGSVRGPGVLRVGVLGASVTLRRRAGLYACDASGRAGDTWRWCGTSSARLVAGRLRDPRLDLLCETEDASRLAFAWVQPLPAARYVAVREARHTEVHAVTEGLPVRVATTREVDAGAARASFDVSEHDAGGRLLRRYRLEAAVAG